MPMTWLVVVGAASVMQGLSSQSHVSLPSHTLYGHQNRDSRAGSTVRPVTLLTGLLRITHYTYYTLLHILHILHIYNDDHIIIIDTDYIPIFLLEI